METPYAFDTAFMSRIERYAAGDGGAGMRAEAV